VAFQANTGYSQFPFSFLPPLVLKKEPFGISGTGIYKPDIPNNILLSYRGWKDKSI